MSDEEQSYLNVKAGQWRDAVALAERATSQSGKQYWIRRAIEMIQPAIDAKNFIEITSLSLLLYKIEPGIAAELANISAEGGEPAAMGLLAILLANTSPREARRWEDAGVKAGSGNALYARAKRLFAVDRSAAVDALLLSAGSGNEFAMEALGVKLVQYGSVDEGLVWLRRAAALGVPSAACQLVIQLYPYNAEEAKSEAEIAAASGNVCAMRFLSDVLIAENPQRSTDWLTRACELGDADACNLIRKADEGRTQRPLFRARRRFEQTFETTIDGKFRTDFSRVCERLRFGRAPEMLNALNDSLIDSEVAVALCVGDIERIDDRHQAVLMQTTERLVWTDDRRESGTDTVRLARCERVEFQSSRTKPLVLLDVIDETSLGLRSISSHDAVHLYNSLRRYTFKMK